MKQETKETFKLIKRNWIPITIMALVLTIIGINLVKCTIFAINYDIEHAKYLENELWDEYVACHGLMMFLDITWAICIVKWTINKIVKNETKRKKIEEKEQDK